MEIQCECGKFRAELPKFPKDTPGRLKCYCDDCQSYLQFIKRADLLDANGGTEIIPIYPSDIKVVQGQDLLKCIRLSSDGMYRFATTCCNTPIANTDDKRPWAGVHRRAFTAKESNKLDQTFSRIGASIMGKFAHGTPPPGTPQTFNLKGMLIVMPFLLKGKILGRSRPSPFFNGTDPVTTPHILSKEERDLVAKEASRVRPAAP